MHRIHQCCVHKTQTKIRLHNNIFYIDGTSLDFQPTLHRLPPLPPHSQKTAVPRYLGTCTHNLITELTLVKSSLVVAMRSTLSILG